MKSLTQAPESAATGQTVYHTGEYYTLGFVTILSHTPGLTWGTEVQDRDGRIYFLSASELFVIEAGDTVVVSDHGIEYMGEVTRIYPDGLKAWFEIDGALYTARFVFDYVVAMLDAAILPSDTALAAVAV